MFTEHKLTARPHAGQGEIRNKTVSSLPSGETDPEIGQDAKGVRARTGAPRSQS